MLATRARLSLMRFLFAILLSVSATAAAAEPPAVCPPAARQPSPAEIEVGTKAARDRGFLWRATKDGRTSYLYGTIHVGRIEWMFPGPKVLAAVRSSDLVALELDLLDPALGELIRKGTAADPRRDLAIGLKERLRAQLRAACLPDELLATTSPVMIATTLTAMSARGAGLDPAYAVDVVYAGLARQLQKPVSSLETVELQLGLLVGQSPHETELAVASALSDLETGTATPMIERMAAMWAEGRLDELENYEKWCECLENEDDRQMMKRMLDDRNPGLARAIDALHTSGRRVFGAVGSLHMIGKTGLPALLAERGYRVERVDFRP